MYTFEDCCNTYRAIFFNKQSLLDKPVEYQEWYYQNMLNTIEKAKEWNRAQEKLVIKHKKEKEQLRANKLKMRVEERRIRNAVDGRFLSMCQLRKLRYVSWGRNDQRIKTVYEKAREWGWHVDHVIPLRGKTVSGLHVWENLQLMHPQDNCKKNNSFDALNWTE